MQTLTAEEFQKKYGSAGLASFSQPVQQKQPGYISSVASGIGNDLSSRFADIGKTANANATDISTGQRPTLGSQIGTGVNIAKNVLGAAANAIEQPIVQTPGVKQAVKNLSEGINWLATSDMSPIKHLGDIIGSNTALQTAVKLYDTNPRFKDTVDAVGNAVRLGADVGVIVNSANFAANVTNRVIQEAKTVATPAIDAAKSGVQGAIADTPATIMNRVARLKPTDYTRFEQLAGKTPGEYLTETGNFGSPDKIIANESTKFVSSMGSVDAELAKLPGVYKTGALQDALEQLVSKAERVSTVNVSAPYLTEAKVLLAKYNQEGLTMPEINQVKRLFEREVKLGYKGVGAQLNPEAVQQATNIDSALREWQVGQAKKLGFKNIDELNKQTQLSKFLINKLGDQLVGQSGLNGINLTDWIVLSGGNPQSVAGFITKKFLSTKSVQAKIAELLNTKEIKGQITPKSSITPENISRQSNPKNLPILSAGKSTIPTTFGGSAIKVAPRSNMEITEKQGIIPSTRATQQPTGTKQLPSTKPTTTASKVNSSIPKDLQPLAAEAQKYKSAEEFISKVRGSATQYTDYTPELRKYGTTPESKRISDLGVDPEKTVTIYRGVSDAGKPIKNAKIVDGDFVTTDRLSAESYAGRENVVSKQVKAKDLIIDYPQDFNSKDPFYTGAEFIYSDSKNPLVPMTDSQLTDFYNKVMKK